MEKKTFVGLDLFKFICALLIVLMHCYCYEPELKWIVNILSSLGVPFFFIVSGYFYREGLAKNGDPKVYFKKYLLRATKMYFAWTIITLPVAWYNLGLAHPDYNAFLKIIYLIRCLFWTGSIGIYWYLLALVYNSAILYYFFTKGKEKMLYFVSGLLFIIGVLYQAGAFDNGTIENFIHIVFGSERNFLNVGLFYMCIGYIFSKNKIPNTNWTPILFGLSLVVTIIIWPYSKLRFMQAISATLLFCIASNLELRSIRNYSNSIRKLSTALYLSHFPFILLFDYYLKNGTYIDFTVTSAFAIFLFYCLKRILPDSYFKTLYG